MLGSRHSPWTALAWALLHPLPLLLALQPTQRSQYLQCCPSPRLAQTTAAVADETVQRRLQCSRPLRTGARSRPKERQLRLG